MEPLQEEEHNIMAKSWELSPRRCGAIGRTSLSVSARASVTPSRVLSSASPLRMSAAIIGQCHPRVSIA
jgi:hypothetical protein